MTNDFDKNFKSLLSESETMENEIGIVENANDGFSMIKNAVQDATGWLQVNPELKTYLNEFTNALKIAEAKWNDLKVVLEASASEFNANAKTPLEKGIEKIGKALPDWM